MIFGILGLAVGNAASLLAARAVQVKLATGKPALDVVILLLIRLALISGAILAAGLLHVLRAAPLAAAGAVVLAVLMIRGVHRTFPSPRLPDMGGFLLCLSALVGLRLLLQVWFISPHNFDAVSYHLTKIPEWIRAGGFTREMGMDSHCTFPAGFELVETWWVVFLHHDVLIEMAGLEFLLLAFAACRALALELGVTGRFAYFAAFLYVMTPGLHLTSTSCLNDCAVAALVLTTMLLLQVRAPAAILGLVLGMGIGVKPIYGYAMPGFLLLYLLRRKQAALRPPPGAACEWGLRALSVFLGLFWYARNFIWFGNPIYPVGSRGLVTPNGTMKIQFGPRLASAFDNLGDLIRSRIYDDFTAYGALLIRISGWGPVALACGVPCLLAVLRKESAFRAVAASFTLSLVSILLLVNHDDWCMRFVLFYPAVLAIASAWIAERYRPTLSVVGIALAYELASTFIPLDLPHQNAQTLWNQDWRTRSAASIVGFHSEEDSVLFYIFDQLDLRGESYLMYRPDFSRRVVYFRGRTPAELARTLDDSGTRILYRARDTDPNDPLLLRCIEEGILRPLGERLYERIPPSR